MTTFDLSTVEIPTPTAYDVDDPLKNLGDLAYVMLQILTVAKANSVKLGGSGDLMAMIESFSASVLAIAEIKEVDEW
jgi:hypothetical protein